MALITDKLEKTLRRKYHALCSKLGLTDEEKRELLHAYGCNSSIELTFYELGDLCNKLEGLIKPKNADFDKWRKRLIASIFAWCKAIGRHDANMRMVKGIACRAAKKETFNEIPLEKLRSLYSAFGKKVHDIKIVDAMTIEEIDYQSFLN